MALSDKSREYLNRRVGGMYKLLENAAATMETEAKTNAPNYWKDRASSAGARGSIHHGVEADPTSKSFALYLAHGQKHGQYLEEGTDPHTIEPKNKPHLHFKASNGNWVRTKLVRHPGTKPRPLLEDTLRKNKDGLIKKILDWWANE